MPKQLRFRFGPGGYLNFEFVSDFDIRISDLWLSMLLSNLSDDFDDAGNIAVRHSRINWQGDNSLVRLSCVWKIVGNVAERISIKRMQVQRNEMNRSPNPSLFQSLDELISSDL